MVDNRGINPITGIFQADNASANKMSEEKNGQGGEYFAQEMAEEESQQQNQTNPFQDRSAQLRASLDSLAMMNASSVNFKKIKEKENKEKKKKTSKKNEELKESAFEAE